MNKEIFGSEKEAVDCIVEFLKTTESPNVMPDNVELAKGHGGFVLYSNKENTKARSVFFPICKENKDKTFKLRNLQDRLSVFEFIDNGIAPNLYLMYDPSFETYTITNPEKTETGYISATLCFKFRSIYDSVRALESKSMRYYAGLLKNAADMVLKSKDVSMDTSAKVQAQPAPMFTLSESRRGEGYEELLDRVAFLNFFDLAGKLQSIRITPDNPDIYHANYLHGYMLIPEQTDVASAYVDRRLVDTYPSVKTLLQEANPESLWARRCDLFPEEKTIPGESNG